MGEQAFQNIKDQINGQQETRTRLSDELDKLKQQRIELNEQIDAQEAKLPSLSPRYFSYRKSLPRY